MADTDGVNSFDPQSDQPSDPSAQSSAARDQERATTAIRSVEVGSETEIERGWRYSIRVFWEGGRLTQHEVELSWMDHDHWSGGSLAPSRVIEAVVRVGARMMGPAELPERFNAANLRRLVAGLDERVRELL